MGYREIPVNELGKEISIIERMRSVNIAHEEAMKVFFLTQELIIYLGIKDTSKVDPWTWERWTLEPVLCRSSVGLLPIMVFGSADNTRSRHQTIEIAPHKDWEVVMCTASDRGEGPIVNSVIDYGEGSQYAIKVFVHDLDLMEVTYNGIMNGGACLDTGLASMSGLSTNDVNLELNLGVVTDLYSVWLLDTLTRQQVRLYGAKYRDKDGTGIFGSKDLALLITPKLPPHVTVFKVTHEAQTVASNQLQSYNLGD